MLEQMSVAGFLCHRGNEGDTPAPLFALCPLLGHPDQWHKIAGSSGGATRCLFWQVRHTRPPLYRQIHTTIAPTP